MENSYTTDCFIDNRSENADGSNNDSETSAILEMIKGIEDKFDEEKCKEAIGDPDIANEWVQNKLMSADLDVLSFATMPHFYQMYQKGEISATDLMSQLESLFIELDRELQEFADMVLYGIAIPIM